MAPYFAGLNMDGREFEHADRSAFPRQEREERSGYRDFAHAGASRCTARCEEAVNTFEKTLQLGSCAAGK